MTSEATNRKQSKKETDEPHVIEHKIPNFWRTMKTQNDVESDQTGCCRGFCFRLLIHPRGTSGTESDATHLSVFLEAVKQDWYPEGWLFPNVRFELTVLNFKEKELSMTSWAHWTFSNEALSRGWQKMIPHTKITRQHGFLDEEGSVIIRGKAEPPFPCLWARIPKYQPVHYWDFLPSVSSTLTFGKPNSQNSQEGSSRNFTNSSMNYSNNVLFQSRIFSKGLGQISECLVPSLKTNLSIDGLTCLVHILYHIREFRREMFLWNTPITSTQCCLSSGDSNSDTPEGASPCYSKSSKPSTKSKQKPTKNGPVVNSNLHYQREAASAALSKLVASESLIESFQTTFARMQLWPFATAVYALKPKLATIAASSAAAGKSSNTIPFSTVVEALRHTIQSVSYVVTLEEDYENRQSINFSSQRPDRRLSIAGSSTQLFVKNTQPCTKSIIRALCLNDVQKVDLMDPLLRLHSQIFSTLHQECRIAYVKHLYSQILSCGDCHIDGQNGLSSKNVYVNGGSSSSGLNETDETATGNAPFSASPCASADAPSLNSGKTFEPVLFEEHLEESSDAQELDNALTVLFSTSGLEKNETLLSGDCALSLIRAKHVHSISKAIESCGKRLRRYPEVIFIFLTPRKGTKKGELFDVPFRLDMSPFLEAKEQNTTRWNVEEKPNSKAFIRSEGDKQRKKLRKKLRLRIRKAGKSNMSRCTDDETNEETDGSEYATRNTDREVLSSEGQSNKKQDRWYALYAMVIQESDPLIGNDSSKSSYYLLIRPEEAGPWYKLSYNKAEKLQQKLEFTEWKCHRDFFCTLAVYLAEDYIDAVINEDVEVDCDLREVNKSLFRRTLTSLGITEEDLNHLVVYSIKNWQNERSKTTTKDDAPSAPKEPAEQPEIVVENTSTNNTASNKSALPSTETSTQKPKAVAPTKSTSPTAGDSTAKYKEYHETLENAIKSMDAEFLKNALCDIVFDRITSFTTNEMYGGTCCEPFRTLCAEILQNKLEAQFVLLATQSLKTKPDANRLNFLNQSEGISSMLEDDPTMAESRKQIEELSNVARTAGNQQRTSKDNTNLSVVTSYVDKKLQEIWKSAVSSVNNLYSLPEHSETKTNHQLHQMKCAVCCKKEEVEHQTGDRGGSSKNFLSNDGICTLHFDPKNSIDPKNSKAENRMCVAEALCAAISSVVEKNTDHTKKFQSMKTSVSSDNKKRSDSSSPVDGSLKPVSKLSQQKEELMDKMPTLSIQQEIAHKIMPLCFASLEESEKYTKLRTVLQQEALPSRVDSVMDSNWIHVGLVYESDLRGIEGFACEQNPPTKRILTVDRRMKVKKLNVTIRAIFHELLLNVRLPEEELNEDTTWTASSVDSFILYALWSDQDPTRRGRKHYIFMQNNDTLDVYRDPKVRFSDSSKPDVTTLIVPLSSTDLQANPCFTKFPLQSDLMCPLLIFKWYDHDTVSLITLGARCCYLHHSLSEYVKDFVLPSVQKLGFLQNTKEKFWDYICVLEESQFRVCQNIRRFFASIKKIGKKTGDVIISQLRKDVDSVDLPMIGKEDLDKLRELHRTGHLKTFALNVYKENLKEALTNPMIVVKSKKNCSKELLDCLSAAKVKMIQKGKQQNMIPFSISMDRNGSLYGAISGTKAPKPGDQKMNKERGTTSDDVPKKSKKKNEKKNIKKNMETPDEKLEDTSKTNEMTLKDSSDTDIEKKENTDDFATENTSDIHLSIDFTDLKFNIDPTTTTSIINDKKTSEAGNPIKSVDNTNEDETINFVISKASDSCKPSIKRLLSKIGRNPTESDLTRIATHFVEVALDDLQKNPDIPSVPVNQDSPGMKWAEAITNLSNKILAGDHMFSRAFLQEIHNAILTGCEGRESKNSKESIETILSHSCAESMRSFLSLRSIAACEMIVCLHFFPSIPSAHKSFQNIGSALVAEASLPPLVGGKKQQYQHNIIPHSFIRNTVYLSLLLMMLGKTKLEVLSNNVSAKRFLEGTVRRLSECLIYMFENYLFTPIPYHKVKGGKQITQVRICMTLHHISIFLRELLDSTILAVLVPRDLEELLQNTSWINEEQTKFLDQKTSTEVTKQSTKKPESTTPKNLNRKTTAKKVNLESFSVVCSIAPSRSTQKDEGGAFNTVEELDASPTIQEGLGGMEGTNQVKVATEQTAEENKIQANFTKMEIVDLKSRVESENRKHLSAKTKQVDVDSQDSKTMGSRNSVVRLNHSRSLQSFNLINHEESRITEYKDMDETSSLSSFQNDPLEHLVGRRLSADDLKLNTEEGKRYHFEKETSEESFKFEGIERTRKLRPHVFKEEPRVLEEGKTWLVIYKPAFWHCSGPGYVWNKSLESRKNNQLVTSKSKDFYQSGKMESVHLWLMDQFPAFETIKKWTELECGLCHRIDLETSGALLVAKTKRTRESLWSQFRRRNVYKEYFLLCHGRMTEKDGVVQTRLLTKDFDSKSRIRSHFTQVVSEGGEDALTEYHVCRIYRRKPWSEITQALQDNPHRVGECSTEKTPLIAENIQASDGEPTASEVSLPSLPTGEITADEEFSLCRCRIVTGRTHQIRVHMKHIGHPLVSDNKYLETRKCQEDRYWCSRMFLHAAKLQFHDTDTPNQTFTEVVCPLSPELIQALEVALVCTEEIESLEKYGIGFQRHSVNAEEHLNDRIGNDRIRQRTGLSTTVKPVVLPVDSEASIGITTAKDFPGIVYGWDIFVSSIPASLTDQSNIPDPQEFEGGPYAFLRQLDSVSMQQKEQLKSCLVNRRITSNRLKTAAREQIWRRKQDPEVDSKTQSSDSREASSIEQFRKSEFPDSKNFKSSKSNFLNICYSCGDLYNKASGRSRSLPRSFHNKGNTSCCWNPKTLRSRSTPLIRKNKILQVFHRKTIWNASKLLFVENESELLPVDNNTKSNISRRKIDICVVPPPPTSPPPRLIDVVALRFTQLRTVPCPK